MKNNNTDYHWSHYTTVKQVIEMQEKETTWSGIKDILWCLFLLITLAITLSMSTITGLLM